MDDSNAVHDPKENEVKELVEDPKKSSGKHKKDEVKELKTRIEDLENQLKRAVADYRNLEKRFEDEKRDTIKFANRDLLLRLIPAFDTLFLAEKYVADEGIKLTIRHVKDSLRDVGVEQVKTVGADFDPSTMEAVTAEEGEENKVIEELRPGFTLNGKLVRPAQVKVGKSSGN
jgi:molecular chaperone GrpE